MSEADDKVIITPAEAESLLADREYVHNYVNPSAGMFVGCDYERANAIEAFHKAKQIELGGENCKHMKHPLVVWDTDKHYSFFEADMDKVAAFEAARAKAEATS